MLLWFLRPNNTSDDRSMIHAHSQTEALKALSVDCIKRLHQCDCKVHQNHYVMLFRPLRILWNHKKEGRQALNF
jgi:hypothetical protein